VVLDAWSGSTGLFDQVLAKAGFAVLKVDNRGTAGRGRAFQAASRGQFGKIELADQLAALQQVLDANPQLDGNRIGFWGWSYGGYMTLYALAHSDRFQAGVAVAPVTNWRLYDSIYTERYMGLPHDNEKGYFDSSPVNAAQSFSGRLLEVHGTGDDNVHLQNTMQMINALISAGRQFDLQLYPRKTHGISGSAARIHLFHRLQEHFEQYLKGGGALSPAAR
jgi:dipeptidyl-peptidase-4